MVKGTGSFAVRARNRCFLKMTCWGVVGYIGGVLPMYPISFGLPMGEFADFAALNPIGPCFSVGYTFSFGTLHPSGS